MAKKKTRKQKILADSRHIVYHLENETSAQVSRPREKKQIIDLPNKVRASQTVIIGSYPHVIKDLRKTATVTGVILLAQIILFIVINGT